MQLLAVESTDIGAILGDSTDSLTNSLDVCSHVSKVGHRMVFLGSCLLADLSNIYLIKAPFVLRIDSMEGLNLQLDYETAGTSISAYYAAMAHGF
jgi:hypothetical protein